MRSLNLIAASLVLGVTASAASAQTNLVVWNFNDVGGNTVNAATRTALFSPDGGVRLSSATMTSTFAFVDGTTADTTGINFGPGTTVNAIGATPAGAALVLQGGISNTATPNNGAFLNFSVNTLDYFGITVTVAMQRNGPGFDTDQFQYFNGVTYVNLGGTFNPSNGSFTTQTFDLGAIPQVNNNPNAQFRIQFNNASNAGGFNALDNLQINASIAAPEPASGLLFVGVILGAAVGYRRRK